MLLVCCAARCRLLLTDSGVEAQKTENVGISADGVGEEAVGAQVGRVGARHELGGSGKSASEEGSSNEELHFDGWWLGGLRSKGCRV